MSRRGQEVSPAIEPGFFLALRSLVQLNISRCGLEKSVKVDRAAPGDNRKPQNLVCVGAGTALSGFLAEAGQASAGRREMWRDRRRKLRHIGFRNGLSRRAERGTPCHGTTSSPGIATAKGVSDRKTRRRHQPLYSAMS